MNLIIPVSFMIDNKTFLTKQFHEKDIRRVGLEWADKGTLSFLSADQFRNLIQSGKIRPGKRSAQSSGFRFNQGEVNKEETVPVKNLSQAEKIIETAQIALGNAGVISEKQTPQRKAQLAKRIADLKLAKIKCSLVQTNFDLAHWQEIDADEKADKINTFDTRGKIVKEAALAEMVSTVVRFNLDGKPLMVLSVPDAKSAIKNWIERGALPRQAMSANYYLVPFLIRGEPAQGKLYKKGQRRDAKQVTESESAEKQGDSLIEGKAIKIGKLTFESFTNGSISGWWVKHITVVHGQGVWKTNTLGWIEERKSSKTSVIPSFLWLEKGNGMENTKALIIWPKGSAPVAGANVVAASNPGTGGLLQAVAKWIQERRPDLVKAESVETEGDTLAEGKAIKIGKLTFESFTNGSISGWWVKHITVVHGQGVWKTNTLGWIEERKSTKTSLVPSFLWLEKGNGEENIKALVIWPKGHATGFPNKDVGGANITRATTDGTSGMLQATAKWITERRPDLVKEETLEPKLTEAEKLMDAAQIALGRAGVLSEEKQAPKITEKMIRDDMGLGSQDIGKGALVIERSGWCANCNKAWYAVVFLAKNRVWWGEISAGDRHATYKNMGKLNLHNPAYAKFDAPGKWKDDAGRKYVPVTESVLNLKKKIRPDTHPSHHLTTEGGGEATPITAATIRDDLGYARIQFMRAGWCADCDKAWYAAVFIVNSKKTYWAEISAGDKHPTYTDFGNRMGSKALEKFDRPGKWKNTVPALKSPFKS